MSRKSGKALVPPVVWGVFLWIVVPAVLFVAGYKVIGPRIGEVPALEAHVEKVGDLIANKAPASVQRVQEPQDEAAGSTDGPAVEVTVEKSKVQPRRETSRRRTKKKPTPPRTETTPVRDEASGDGAMSGGDSPSDASGGG